MTEDYSRWNQLPQQPQQQPLPLPGQSPSQPSQPAPSSQPTQQPLSQATQQQPAQQQPTQQPLPQATQQQPRPLAAQQQPAQPAPSSQPTQQPLPQATQQQPAQPWHQAASQSQGYYHSPGQPQPSAQPQQHPYSTAQTATQQPAQTHAAAQTAAGQSPQSSQPYRSPVATAQAAQTAAQTAAYQRTAPPIQATAQRHTAAKPKQSKALPLVMGLVGVLAGALVTAGILLALFLPTNNITAAAYDPDSYKIDTGSGVISITPPDEDTTLAEVVAAKALPSVVNIDSFASAGSGYFSDTGNSGQLEQFGLGSGVVISADGYILTNHHVINGGSDFLVRFDQDTQYRATVVGSDPESDIAVLKVDATGLTPMEIGDSSAVKVGEWVMALGSPFGLEKSVSTGIVSATLRSTAMESSTGVNFYAKMIQTDAAINPGNSGGALVNSEGKLIGVNTIIASASGSSSGVGFAIPSNYAMGIANQIMSGKQVEHAYLGVQLRNVDASKAINLDSDVLSGAVVGVIVESSPAANSGLQEGDIITKIDNMRVSSAAELIINIRGYLPGDKVTLEFVRGNQAYTVDVTLGSDKGISS